MTLAFVTVVILLGQSAPRQAAPPAPPAAPAPPPVNCFAQTDPAARAFCEGQDALSQDRQDAGAAARAGAKARAVEAFRRAADLARDMAFKKRALEQLESLYGPEHLNQPYAVDPILRELMALSHNDLAPMFRLAKHQELQGQFDAAESTLLGARQQKPDDAAPYRELGEYFTRRAAAMTAVKESDDRARESLEGVKPDKDGVYDISGPVEAPEQLTADATPLPPGITATGLSGAVGLEIVVDETGRVVNAKVVNSVPGLDTAALATVQLWRFKPAMLNGRPVPVRFPAVVKFGGGIQVPEPASSSRL